MQTENLTLVLRWPSSQYHVLATIKMLLLYQYIDVFLMFFSLELQSYVIATAVGYSLVGLLLIAIIVLLLIMCYMCKK